MELKPCPFCGGSEFKQYSGASTDLGHYESISCQQCDYQFKHAEDSEGTVEEEWNNRPQNQKLIEALEEIVNLNRTDPVPSDIAQKALDEVNNNE